MNLDRKTYTYELTKPLYNKVSVTESGSRVFTDNVTHIEIKSPKIYSQSYARELASLINRHSIEVRDKASQIATKSVKDAITKEDTSEIESVKSELGDNDAIWMAKAFLSIADSIESYSAVKTYDLVLNKLLPEIATFTHIGSNGKEFTGSKINPKDVLSIDFDEQSEIAARVIAFFF